MFPFQSGELSFQVSNNFEDADTNTLIYQQEVEPLFSAAAAATSTIDTTNFLINESHHQPLNSNFIDTTNLLINESHHRPLNSNFKIPKTRKSRSGKSISNHATTTNNNSNEVEIDNAKKVTHREVERQRRQEMSNLHSSLRSLIPMDYIKGKKSVSDHITEATRYIQDLEKNVKELGEKREILKNSFDTQITKRKSFGWSSSSTTTSSNTTCNTSSSSNTTNNDYNVSIHKFSKTIQIEITAGVGEEDPYPLSITLKVLAQEGLDVVSCVTSKVNQKWIYVILCEVDDIESVNSCHLKEKLMSAVSPNYS